MKEKCCFDIEEYWCAVTAQDEERLAGFFHPAAHVYWHHTGELFTAEEFLCANCRYPLCWEEEIERVEEIEEGLLSAVRIYSRQPMLSFHVVSFMKLHDGRILRMDEYWGEDGEIPAWRKQLQLGKRF